MKRSLSEHDGAIRRQPGRWLSMGGRFAFTVGGCFLSIILAAFAFVRAPAGTLHVTVSEDLSFTGASIVVAGVNDLANSALDTPVPAGKDPVTAVQSHGSLRLAGPRPTAVLPLEDRAAAMEPAPTLTPVPTQTPVPGEQAVQVAAPEQPLPLLMDDLRFTSEPGLTTEALQALLERFPGPLKWMRLPIGDREHTIAEVLISQSSMYSLNPKVMLTVLEMRHRLLSDPNAAIAPADLAAEIRWMVRELYRGERTTLSGTHLSFIDQSTAPRPPDLNPASYVVTLLLAQMTTPDQLRWVMLDSPDSFLATYTRLFEDPRQPLTEPLALQSPPFLSYPKATRSPITSFFDHEYPFLIQNGSLVSHHAQRENRIAYDGHNGWDYGGRLGGSVLAAAPGKVMFAGWSDDGCWTPAGAVVIDHGNGYRTLYWHMRTVVVQTGQEVERGQPLGEVGDTGCAVGPHLHFQVQFNGRTVDPYGWCGDPKDDPWAQHPFGATSHWLWIDIPNSCDMPKDSVVVSTDGPGFSTTGEWGRVPIGVAGGSRWAVSRGPDHPAPQPGAPQGGIWALTQNPPPPSPTPVPEASATWTPQLPAAGRYRVLAYIPYVYNGHRDTNRVRYTIQHADGVSEVEIDQSLFVNMWADLGTYTFDPAKGASVTLSNHTSRSLEGVWAGAITWMPVGP